MTSEIDALVYELYGLTEEGRTRDSHLLLNDVNTQRATVGAFSGSDEC